MKNIIKLTREIRFYCSSWSPETKLLGNICASQIITLCDFVLSLPQSYIDFEFLEDLVNQTPNGLNEQNYLLACDIDFMGYSFAKDFPLICYNWDDFLYPLFEKTPILGREIKIFGEFCVKIPRDDT